MRRLEEFPPFVWQTAVGGRACEHQRDILVGVAREPCANRRDFEHELGMLLGVDEELPDIVRDALKREGAQLGVPGRDRPRMAGSAKADAVYGAIVLPCVQRGALAVTACFVAPEHEYLRGGGSERA